MQLSQVLQLPEKQWTPDADPVLATLTVVAPNYTQDKFQRFCQDIQLKDDTGVSSKVTIKSKFLDGLMSQDMVNRKARWRLKWWGRNQSVEGYCLDKMDTLPTNAPAAMPQPAQPPQQTAQRPNAPQKDEKAEGMVRHGVVCAMIAGNCVDYTNALELTRFIMTGQIPPPQNVNSEDIPF